MLTITSHVAPVTAELLYGSHYSCVQLTDMTRSGSDSRPPAIEVDALPTGQADRLVGPVVKASAPRAAHPGFESHLRRDFLRVEAYQ